jgi:hypothetical protein
MHARAPAPTGARHDDRRAGRPRELDRSRGAVGVELGSRLVEQQQPRLEREHRGCSRCAEAPPESRPRPSARWPAPTATRAAVRGAIWAGGVPTFEPERNLCLDPREDDLVLDPGRASPLCRRAPPAASAACRVLRSRPAPKTGRRGSAAPGRPARGAASTCPSRTAPSRRRPRLPRSPTTRHGAPAALPGR